MRKPLFALVAALAAGATVLLGSLPAEAGPPLICWPIDAGGARTLPLDGGEGGKYDVRRLVPDTLALLGSDAPTLARMETLRRATMHANGKSRVADALQIRLMARALDAEAVDEPSATAWFDAAYFVSCRRQLDHHGIGERSWFDRARGLRGEDPAVEMAGALMTAMGKENHDRCVEHVERALAGGDPLVTRNLETLLPDVVTEARARAKRR